MAPEEFDVSAVIKLRTDIAQNFSTNNPVLEAGELCWSIDKGNLKIGAGANNWGDEPIYCGYVTTTITLPSASWLGLSLLITPSGVPVGSNIIATPLETEAVSKEVRFIGWLDGQLLFRAASAPSTDLHYRIGIFC